MAPTPSVVLNGRPVTEPRKSWKKVNEERKALRKQRKQDKLLRNLEKGTQLAEVSGDGASANQAPKPDPSTVSIAVPGSILENAQSPELRSYVAGQIARAACIFRVNEVIVYDDVIMTTARETKRNYDVADDDEGHATVRSSSLQLARILQYLECPQYLRKFFFPMHKDLKYAGLLNPLDAPHHLRQQNVFLYREGVVVADKKAKPGHCYANAGLLNDVLVNRAIESGVRVTLKLQNLNEGTRKLRATVVSPSEPRRETGIYWGYTVRIAHSLSEIFTKGPYSGGYDLTIGTSDRGSNVHEVSQQSLNYAHALIVFGGLRGLEAALANDDKLDVDEPSLLFDHYINVLPKQGSRTIRTEEAILIAMAALKEKLQPRIEDVNMDLSEFLPQSDEAALEAEQPIENWRRQKNCAETGLQLPSDIEMGNPFKKNDTVKSKKTKTKDKSHCFKDVPSLETVVPATNVSSQIAASKQDMSRFD